MARIKQKTGESLPRAPDGHVNNCALANGEEQKSCQICMGACPDANLFCPPDLGEAPATDSVDLIKALEKADKESAADRARAVVFDSANAATETPISPMYARMVERLFAPSDWEKIQDEHVAWMDLGDKHTEEAFIRKAHQQGPGIIRKLYGCYLQIRLTRESWEKENDVVLGAMRLAATEALQDEKTRGARNKTITKEDVADQAATMFKDEWRIQETKRLKYKLVEDRAKHDVEVAGTRCKHLDTMLSRLR